LGVDDPEDAAIAIPLVVVVPPSTPRLPVTMGETPKPPAQPEAVEPANSLAPVATAKARPAPEVVPSAPAPAPATLQSSTSLDEDLPVRPRRRVGAYVAVGTAVAAAAVGFALRSSPAKRPRTPHPAATQVAAVLPAPTAPATAASAEIPTAPGATGAASADVPKGAEAADAAAVGADGPKVAEAADAGVVAPSEGPKDTSAAPSAITATADAGATDTEAGMVTVTFNVWPTGARIAFKGREIGRSPFKMQIRRGDTRAVEVVFPGFKPRKVVVDGSQPEISFGLRPEEPAAPAAPAAPPASAEP
jgi:hypothetical protein